MSRLATSFVLGYHGCDRRTGLKAVNGEVELIQSDKDFDWLGPGAYFWESDPQRAREWAEWKAQRGDFSDPFVIGAVIDLRNCLDLSTRKILELLAKAYQSFKAVQEKAGHEMPVNKGVPGQPNADRVLRYLDCAVIRHLHSILEAPPPDERTIEPFDSVRGMFSEGARVYPKGGFREKSHVQIAVRNLDCIRGVFLPR